MTRDSHPERRRTRTLEIGPWIKNLLIAGATSTFLSLPAILWHAHKSMQTINSGMEAVQRMATDYNVVLRQNVTLQVQVHRLTDAVNDLRHEKNLAPIEQQPIVGAAPTEAWNRLPALPLSERPLSLLRTRILPGE